MVDTPCLPHVHKLRIFLSDRPVKRNCVYDNATNNALEFARLLKRIAPAASSVVVRSGKGNWNLEDGDERALGVFMHQLFIKARSSALDLGRVNIMHRSTIDYIPQLTLLKLQGLSIADVRTSLLHKCSNTLLDLNIATNDPRLLICDVNGNAVVYPNLRILVANSYTISFAIDVSAVITTPKSIVPFPRLKRLALCMSYPYSDNVLFRGNSDTLQYLGMHIDGNTVTRLSEYGVFENRHKSLRSVEIIEAAICTELVHIPESRMSNFLINLLDTAQVLGFDTLFVANKLMAAMQNNDNF
ncbi:hypothetical protein GGI08_006491, partial [Coemansia sp. S2]